jgi:hypothetical protein
MSSLLSFSYSGSLGNEKKPIGVKWIYKEKKMSNEKWRGTRQG